MGIRLSRRLLLIAFVLAAVPALWTSNGYAYGLNARLLVNGVAGNAVIPSGTTYTFEGHTNFDTTILDFPMVVTCYAHAGMPWTFARNGVAPHQSGGNFFDWSTNGNIQTDGVTGELSYVFNGKKTQCAGQTSIDVYFNQYANYPGTVSGNYVNGSGSGHQIDDNARVFARSF